MIAESALIMSRLREKETFTVLSAILVLACLSASAAAEGNFTREMVCSLSVYPTAHAIAWECPGNKEQCQREGLFSPKDMLATRFQTYKQITYLAFPRFRCGVVATLASFQMEDFCKVDPLLTPFPNIALNKISNNALGSIIDIYLDLKDVLWVLDSGVAFTLETSGPNATSGPAIIAFCPKTSALINRITLSQFVSNESRLQHILAEVTDEGKTFIYISDAGTRTVIVWNVDLMTGFKMMLPVDMTSHPLSQDVLYIALVRKDFDQTMMYLTYLMGKNMFGMKTSNIRSGKVDGAVMSIGKKAGPMVVLGTDGGQTIYLRMRTQREILMWDTDREFRPVPARQEGNTPSTRLPTHVAPGYRNLLWVLESNFFDYLEGNMGSLGAVPRLYPLVRPCQPPTNPCTNTTYS